MIFNIAPQIKGYLAPADLLTSEGTFFFGYKKNKLLEEGTGTIFQIQGEGFIFNLSIQNSNFIVQRNETISVLNYDKVPEGTRIQLSVIWSYTELKLLCNYGNKEGDYIKAVVPNSPIFPPNNLLKWTRLNNLIPTKEYETAEEFRTKIHSCLLTINEKIKESGGIYPFWNTSYDKGKITNRQPKNEIEVQPIIHCLLSDQMLASSIEIIPEFKGGAGNLDFLFIGQVKNRGSVYFCAEFKNAHSDKVFDGLTKQLPAYITSKGADYGAYCVLNYFGEWLKPQEKQSNIESDLMQVRTFMGKPFSDQIRVFNFRLSKSISASKI